jgi:hypothetical protein
MNERLMQIVIDTLVFLEMSDADTVDPDAAVREIENIAFHLRSLLAGDLQRFLDFIEKKGAEAVRQGDSARGKFLRGLPQSLGLQ